MFILSKIHKLLLLLSENDCLKNHRKRFKHISNKYNFFQKKKNHMNLFYDQHDVPVY